MPIVGNLSEFPLPEVLLLIGQRTGRLRLLDVPEFGVLEIDISNGSVQTMRIGSSMLAETERMLDKLGVIVQSQNGMFDFQSVPVTHTDNEQHLTIHDLAMQLVCHVDEQASQAPLATIAGQRHRLVDPQPEIWMEPELHNFLYMASPLLNGNVTLSELARDLQMDIVQVDQNLAKLRHLGVIELVEPSAPVVPIPMEPKMEPDQALVARSNAYFRVARMTDNIRKLSSQLPAV